MEPRAVRAVRGGAAPAVRRPARARRADSRRARRRPRLRHRRADARAARGDPRDGDGRDRLVAGDAREGGRARRRAGCASSAATSAASRRTSRSTSCSRTPRCTGARITRDSSQRLTRAVAPGGQLAFQVPDNFDHPSHRSAEQAASHEPFRTALGGSPHPRHVLAPEAYASILDRLGYAEQTVRLQIYGIRLDSRKDIVAWVEGSLLSDYRARLPARALRRVPEALPPDPLRRGARRAAVLLHVPAHPRLGSPRMRTISTCARSRRGQNRASRLA